MPGARLLSVRGDEALRDLADDLRRAGNSRSIDARLRRDLHEVARDAVKAVRANIRAIPSKGQSARRGRRSLRSEMAAATESKVRTTRRPGVIVWVNPGRMPSGKRNLPAYMEGQYPFHRWRHPTFGRSPWQTQRKRPYFERAVAPAQGEAQRVGERIINDLAQQIERG